MSERIIEIVGWVLGFFLVICMMIGSYSMSRNVVGTEVKSKEIEVILDAGHGGADPGKIGINEVLEKDLNLSITMKIKNLLEAEGIGVYLTRTDDTRINSKGGEWSKTEDMKDRVEVINEILPRLVVSIHQNSYTSEEIKGAQVFYYERSEEGRRYAEIMQENLRKIDETNHRQAKGNDTYFLLKKTEAPTIIVECGFLSNRKEAENLTKEEYQEKIAAAIKEGIKSCLESTSQN